MTPSEYRDKKAEEYCKKYFYYEGEWLDGNGFAHSGFIRGFIEGRKYDFTQEPVIQGLVEALRWYQLNYTPEFNKTEVNVRFDAALTKFEELKKEISK